MIIDKELTPYLTGSKFETDYKVIIDAGKIVPEKREGLLKRLLEGKSVIHIGCADHKEIIESKIKSNIWLHKILTDICTRCIGVDINKESIDYIREQFKYDNVVHADISSEIVTAINDNKWDYAVFGEILEHLDNPVHFLSAFRNNYPGKISKFIVSVPNIMNISRYRFMKSYVEIINTDHRFWFTPYTILKILSLAGYKPEEIFFTNLSRLSLIELIIRKIKKILGLKIKYPFYYYNTIIISGDIN